MERVSEIMIIIDRILEDIKRDSSNDVIFFRDKMKNLIESGKLLEHYYKELGELNDYYKN